MEKWTQKEIDSAVDYFVNCDKENVEECFEHVSDMMYSAGYAKRTKDAYKSKLYKHWKDEANKP